MVKKRQLLGTRSIADLSPDQRAEYDDTGCEEGYEWWLRHQGVLTTESSHPTERDYPPAGHWSLHIHEYRQWQEPGGLHG